MNQSVIRSIQFQQNGTFSQKNILQATIHNYSNVEATLVLNNIARPLPAASLVSGSMVSHPFVIDGFGSEFDADFEIEMRGIGRVVIDFQQRKKIENCQ